MKKSPKIHEKKIWPKYFEAVSSGEKNFEVRLADWQCRVGDFLWLREWDPETKKYTGRELKRQVTYVAKTKKFDFFPPDQVERYGFQVLGLVEPSKK